MQKTHSSSTSPAVSAKLPADFSSLPLEPALHAALKDAGYQKPTSIQQQAIPPALAGKDLLGIAQTGTGKTAAFALPILQQLLKRPRNPRPLPRAPLALVLAPTRELAAQIGKSFAVYGSHTRIRCAVVFGGVGQFPQVRAIASGAEVLVATPGRLLDLMQQRHVDLRAVSFLVLDEADHMIDMGFIQPIRRILAALPKQRQSMLFSATMPATIQHLADNILDNPVRVEVSPVSKTADRVEQRLYKIPQGDKLALLCHLLKKGDIERALIFTRTKHGADKIVKKLDLVGIHANAIHGNKAQTHRTRTLDAFRSGHSPILIAPDLAARGIDVAGISHVFNYDMPTEEETYVHRIGRTARAEAEGVAVTFCSAEDRDMLRRIEKLIRTNIPVFPTPGHLPQMPLSAARPHARTPERASSHGGRQHAAPSPRGRGHEARGHGDRRAHGTAHGAAHGGGHGTRSHTGGAAHGKPAHARPAPGGHNRDARPAAHPAAPRGHAPHAAPRSHAPHSTPHAPRTGGLGGNKRPRPRFGRR